jgi:hypothetical protein
VQCWGVRQRSSTPLSPPHNHYLCQGFRSCSIFCCTPVIALSRQGFLPSQALACAQPEQSLFAVNCSDKKFNVGIPLPRPVSALSNPDNGPERSPRVRHDHQVPPRPSGKESQGSSDDAAVSNIQRGLSDKPRHLMPGSARIAHQQHLTSLPHPLTTSKTSLNSSVVDRSQDCLFAPISPTRSPAPLFLASGLTSDRVTSHTSSENRQCPTMLVTPRWIQHRDVRPAMRRCRDVRVSTSLVSSSGWFVSREAELWIAPWNDCNLRHHG